MVKNILKSKRSLGQPYLGKKLIDGVWTCGEAQKENGCLMYKGELKSKEFLKEDCREIFEEFLKTGDKGTISC